jgi:hypothetical protein
MPRKPATEGSEPSAAFDSGAGATGEILLRRRDRCQRRSAGGFADVPAGSKVPLVG